MFFLFMMNEWCERYVGLHCASMLLIVVMSGRVYACRRHLMIIITTIRGIYVAVFVSVRRRGRRSRRIQVLSLVFHEHVRYEHVALVYGVIDGLNVVEALRVHVAATLAQRVNYGRVVGAHGQHERCVAVFVFELHFGAMVDQELDYLQVAVLFWAKEEKKRRISVKKAALIYCRNDLRFCLGENDLVLNETRNIKKNRFLHSMGALTPKIEIKTIFSKSDTTGSLMTEIKRN